jgi:hypothetical protein
MAENPRKQVTERFKCGHTVRVTLGNLERYGLEKCSDCRMAEWQATAPERRRKRRQELREESEALGPRPTPTEAQRRAQRVLVAASLPSSGRMFLDVETGELRFVERRNVWGPTLEDLGEHLNTLGVPHGALLTRLRDQATGKVVLEAYLTVDREARDALILWIPSLAAKIAEVEAGR